MTYVTPRETRYHTWCRAKGWRPTLTNWKRWTDMGEPVADPVAGTKLDQMVLKDMGLGDAS